MTVVMMSPDREGMLSWKTEDKAGETECGSVAYNKNSRKHLGGEGRVLYNS